MAKLIFRTGAMGCGKSMNLLQVAFNYGELGLKSYIFKPAVDTKAGDSISSRIGPTRKCDKVFTEDENLFNIIAEDFADANCILVDEAQFMTAEQVDQLMQVAAVLDITVIAYGLRLNCHLTDEGFEGATRLLQVAQNIEELKTLCDCGKKATINARFVDGVLDLDGPAVMIDDGTHDIVYHALCPRCYFKAKELAEDGECYLPESQAQSALAKTVERKRTHKNGALVGVTAAAIVAVAGGVVALLSHSRKKRK